MALICPACSTENREGANFCKHCGGKLAAAAATPISSATGPDSRAEREWATTAPAQLRAPAIGGGLVGAGLPAAAMGPAGSVLPGDEMSIMAALARLRRPTSPPRKPRARKASKPRPPRVAAPRPWHARGNWLWLLLLVAALLMIAAGWHGYGTDQPAEQSEATAPAAPSAAPPPLPESAMAAVPESPASAAMPPAAEAPPQGPAEAAPAAATNLKPPAAATNKPRKQALPAAPEARAPKSEPAAVAAPAPSQAAPPSADPLAFCGDRNFIAKAQCMAAQCAKPEYKPHAQCEAVRRQQRLEEEKRNPTLIN